MYLPVTLGNKVWEDTNGNGIQDTNEPGVDGLEVTLLDANGDEVDTTLTASDGSYWFVGLPPGEYSVQYVLPPDFVFSLAPSNELLGKLGSFLFFNNLLIYIVYSPSFSFKLCHLYITHKKQTMLKQEVCPQIPTT